MSKREQLERGIRWKSDERDGVGENDMVSKVSQ
jgi:hypothetical protein